MDRVDELEKAILVAQLKMVEPYQWSMNESRGLCRLEMNGWNFLTSSINYMKNRAINGDMRIAATLGEIKRVRPDLW